MVERISPSKQTFFSQSFVVWSDASYIQSERQLWVYFGFNLIRQHCAVSCLTTLSFSVRIHKDYTNIGHVVLVGKQFCTPSIEQVIQTAVQKHWKDSVSSKKLYQTVSLNFFLYYENISLNTLKGNKPPPEYFFILSPW